MNQAWLQRSTVLSTGRGVTCCPGLDMPATLYYGVDEPRTPEQVERCLREARRREQGLPMFTAINSTQAHIDAT